MLQIPHICLTDQYMSHCPTCLSGICDSTRGSQAIAQCLQATRHRTRQEAQNIVRVLSIFGFASPAHRVLSGPSPREVEKEEYYEWQRAT